MAEVTVEQLAAVVGAPVERLMQQMKDAGVSKTDAKQSVSDAEKRQLLAHLKKVHGDAGEGAGSEPSKITLKRKTVSKMKVSGNSGKNKVVNVEVRKKRTYVKQEQQAKEGDRKGGEQRGGRKDDRGQTPR